MAPHAILLALAGIVALLTAWLAARPARSRRSRVVTSLLPGLAAICALLAADNPALPLGNRPASHIVLLLDASASARSSPWRDPAWVRHLAAQQLPPSTRLTLVAFAADSRLLLDDVSPDDPARWPSAWPDFATQSATDLPAALAWRSPAEARGDALAPRWLLTDGLAPWPPTDLPAAATLLPPTSDLAVTNLALRDNALWARIRATGPIPATTLDILKDHQPLAHQTLSFDSAGARWITLPADPATAALYEVRLAAHDPWPEDDAARLLHTPPGRARILHLHPGDPLPGDAWKLAADGWQIVQLDEVACDDLGPEGWRTLNTFVRDTGGSLLLVGARHAFGPGHYTGDAEALSPLSSMPLDAPPAQIVFLLDASASMNESAAAGEQKFRLAARGVLAAAGLLNPHDRLSVIAFNTAATLLSENRTELAGKLAAVAPAGGTAPDSALDLAAHALAADAPRKLLILLTDGEIPTLNLPAWQSLLRRTHAQLAIVAPPAANTGPLAALAKNGAFLNANSPDAWPVLLQQAVQQILAGRTRADALTWHTDTLAVQTTTAWAETWLKPNAREIAAAATADKQPWTLAAIAQRGLGQVAAAALAPDAPGADALLRQLTTALLPPAGDRRFTLAATPDATGWLLAVDALADGRFLDHQPLTLRVPAADAPLSLPFQQTAPGHYTVHAPSVAGTLVLLHEADAEHVVARPEAPTLAAAEFPAMATPQAVPAGITQINPAGDTLWQPRLAGSRLELALPLWLASAAAALAALFCRRPLRHAAAQ